MKSISRYQLLIFTIAGVAAAMFIGVAASASSSGANVNQVALQACRATHVNCEAQVSGLTECMRSHATCNQTGDDYRRPFSTRTDGTQGPMTRDEAVSRALALSPQATSQSPVVAKEMSLQQFASLTHQRLASFGGLGPGTAVWVVTVRAPVETDAKAGQTPSQKSAYTVVFDVNTHAGIVTCLGCSTLG